MRNCLVVMLRARDGRHLNHTRDTILSDREIYNREKRKEEEKREMKNKGGKRDRTEAAQVKSVL